MGEVGNGRGEENGRCSCQCAQHMVFGILSQGAAVAIRRGLLSIVDLAGSERVSKSGSEGTRLEEAKRINKSISSLGNCIAALSAAGGKGALGHVPFRDSKLTRLLTDSLGGNTKTSLCATVGPSLQNYDETFCTLLLATRAMAVKTHARVNERIERGSEGAGRQVAPRRLSPSTVHLGAVYLPSSLLSTPLLPIHPPSFSCSTP